MTNPSDQGASEATMHVPPTDECYRLLSTHELGRLGFNASTIR